MSVQVFATIISFLFNVVLFLYAKWTPDGKKVIADNPKQFIVGQSISAFIVLLFVAEVHFILCAVVSVLLGVTLFTLNKRVIFTKKA